MHQLIAQRRERFGRSVVLEFRMDAAFVQQALLKLLARLGCFYAVKAPSVSGPGSSFCLAGALEVPVPEK